MPQVSIGMPVYNGENFIEQAIESLLRQTFGDFELIISDNASTDATASICERFAAQDARIRYLRANKNHGASWNHEVVIRAARAPLFKLAAHDDTCESTHLERCVSALKDNPNAVLAYTKTLMRFEQRDQLSYYNDEVALESPIAALRYGDLLNEAPPAFPIFGVVRLNALLSIPRFEAYKASDRVVLSRLALMSPFIYIDEPLFHYRWHADNASNLMNTRDGFYRWWNPNGRSKKVFPELRLAWEHLKSPFLIPLNFKQRRACLREWRLWLRTRWPHVKDDVAQLWGGEANAFGQTDMIQKAIARSARRHVKTQLYGPDKH